MNKNELVKEMSKKSNMTIKNCCKCLNAFQSTIIDVLSKGESLNLMGFGKFDVKTRNERRSFNPYLKKIMRLPKTRVPYFKAGKNLKVCVV